MDTFDSPHVAPAIVLHELAGSYTTAQLIFVAARLGVADHIAAGVQNADELAVAADANPDSFYRFMRALATVGVVDEIAARQFALTPVGAYLQTDTQDSLHALVQWADEVEWDLWSHAEQCVKTGKSAFELVHGMGMFEYLGRNPQKMHSLTQR